MTQELDYVVLTVDLPQFDLASGGYQNSRYAACQRQRLRSRVGGETIAVTSLLATQVHPILQRR